MDFFGDEEKEDGVGGDDNQTRSKQEQKDEELISNVASKDTKIISSVKNDE